MNKKGNRKVTLSVNSAIYDAFRQYCAENAIMLSKKVEIWMKKELAGTLKLKRKVKNSKSKNKKITLSINASIYNSFKQHCEENAIMLSKKVEIWMRIEIGNE